MTNNFEERLKNVRDLLRSTDEMFENAVSYLPKDIQKFIREQVYDRLFGELRESIVQSRPPRIMVIGRTGHGKSSFINALAGRRVAETSKDRPGQHQAEEHPIVFPSGFSWNVIDSRGLFDATTPDGASETNAADTLKRDLETYDPDVIIHVLPANERAISEDLTVFRRFQDGFRVSKPTIIVLNKADAVNPLRAWPPEAYPQKAGELLAHMRYLADEVLRVEHEDLVEDRPFLGFLVKDSAYQAIIPVASYREEGEEECVWNHDLVRSFIGNVLPKSAQFSFYVAQNNMSLLREYTDNIINSFVVAAGGVGGTPIPVADIVVLTPLQMLMIALIGTMAGRPPSMDTATEFLAAAGVNVGVGLGLRAAAQTILRVFPPTAPFAPFISAGVASQGTLALGKAAQAYFFKDVTDPGGAGKVPVTP
ncbi:50S ribosome-binding GTPase [bacterium]|nr:50S ribosome-binding GTPase [bacterium]